MKKILCSIFLLLPGMQAFAGDYSFTFGAEYTEGDYGTGIDTTGIYAPFTLEYTTDKFLLGITVPYVRISGSEDVISVSSTKHPSPMLSTSTTTVSSEERTDSGLGDIILTGSYQLQAETKDSAWLALTGKIKLGTADEKKFLGTGENDYSLQVDIAKQALFGNVGYKIYGDTAETNFDNVLFATVGVTIPANAGWKAGLEYYLEQAAVSGADDIQEVTFSLGKQLQDKKYLNLYLFTGFTDSSADWGVGFTIKHQL